MHYASDARWWRVYGHDVDDVGCAGERWASCDAGGGHKLGGQDFEWCRVARSVTERINWIEVVDEPGLCTRPGRIHTGMNSGYQSIGLAWSWGAARIVLTGYDMQKTGGKSHFHGDHKGGLPGLGNLPDWCRRMVPLATDLRAKGIDVVNATRVTALTCFRRATIKEALGG